MATLDFPIMAVIDESGDDRIQWDPKDPEQVGKARQRFEDLTKPYSQGGKGYMAYRVNKRGGEGEVITAFDPNAERIILRPQMIGG